MFEDYNYDLYNKYILVDPSRYDGQTDLVDLGDFVPLPVLKSKKGIPLKNVNEDN